MAFQQFSASVFGASPQTATFAGSRKPQAGNLLIACAWSNNSAAMALGTSTGWTPVTSAYSPDSTRQMQLSYKQSVGTESVTTLTGGGNLYLQVYEYAGFQAVLDGTPGNSTNVSASNSLATAALTTTQPDSLVFGCWAMYGAAATSLSVDKGALRLTSSPGVSGAEYFPGALLSASAITLSWTLSGGNLCFSTICAFKANTNNGFFGFM